MIFHNSIIISRNLKLVQVHFPGLFYSQRINVVHHIVVNIFFRPLHQYRYIYLEWSVLVLCIQYIFLLLRFGQKNTFLIFSVSIFIPVVS